MAKPIFTPALASLGLVALSAGLLQGGGLAASLVLWLAVNVLITASFRFVTLIGELNFAVAGFVGLGAYMAGVGSVTLNWPFLLTLAASAVFAGLISLVFGYITLRAKGPYFMLISFAFTEVIRMIYTKTEAIGGSSGMVGIFPPAYLDGYFPALVVAMVLALLWALWSIEKSDFGKVLVAIRNNDAIVETVGINVHLTKVICLGISSVVAGIAGALLAYSNNVISPGDFGFLLAVYALAYLKVGGESHILGAVVGAVVLTLLGQFALSFGPYEHIFYGAAIVISVLLMPGGLIGLGRHFNKRAPRLRPVAKPQG
ncbi:branched-chain amino acid ABC transporter permease [Achromobacter xylosoxidans]|uniref:Branched-chain amino acid ABC transporter permease n=1 Tax=Achromobacter spanius TaxID=217203 RepID=A0A2S5GNX6_9BURK|nr:MULTISPECIES: branched-chain amino acid ABC transporter permease [Achromobacter]MDD7991897.1 branched-chain amino acid ABC transporter permease [Achromobacter xylosoxidans]MDQ6211642.1 branched-chain amino acid ABC transporter permease [Achromobacter insolitus]MDZ5618890.1 branched-chain amino acid ABC transporter permease [Achromobacter xylosoxidans]MDZ5624590.1 branched-chain amino acid ABC transporter permease [Achromobacter xylosoxidans]MDZ5684856.1 branched-chain amino acid ABC transpo